MFYYIGKLVGNAGGFAGEKNAYFAFALTGMAVSTLFNGVSSSIMRAFSRERAEGTFEELFVTLPGRPFLLAFSCGAYNTLSSIISCLFLFVCGALAGASFHIASFTAFMVIVAISGFIFAGFSLLSAGLFMFTRKSASLTGHINSLGAILGGAFFPVSIMPEWLQSLSFFIPLRHIIESFRIILLEGGDFYDVYPSAVTGAIFAVFFFLTGLYVYKAGIMNSMRKGGLSFY